MHPIHIHGTHSLHGDKNTTFVIEFSKQEVNISRVGLCY